MDRGAWQATVYGVTGVKHDLATKLPATYLHTHTYIQILSFPGGSMVKKKKKKIHLPMQETWVWSPGEGNGNPLKYFCLENPMDGGAWWATVRGVAKSRTWLKQRHTHTNPFGQDPSILGLILTLSALWENDGCKSDYPGRVQSQDAKHCKLLWKHFTMMIQIERW